MVKRWYILCFGALLLVLGISASAATVDYEIGGGAPDDTTNAIAFWSAADASIEWKALYGNDEPNDGLANVEIDFVGNSNSPGLYWADDGTYVFFRFRVAAATADASKFTDAHHVLIDVVGYEYGRGFVSDETEKLPDYSIAWDSKSNQPDDHGLEMTHISVKGSLWNGINMDDLDGNNAKKLVNDINDDGRTADGYVRTMDTQGTIDFGDTTFVDYAVSWSYLTTYTDLAKDQTWNITVASVANATDHNNLTGDIGGGATPTDPYTVGWFSTTPLLVIPEPSTFVLICCGTLALALRRRRHRSS